MEKNNKINAVVDSTRESRLGFKKKKKNLYAPSVRLGYIQEGFGGRLAGPHP